LNVGETHASRLHSYADREKPRLAPGLVRDEKERGLRKRREREERRYEKEE
jgi:hypothetical protein